MHIVFYGPEGSGKGTQAKLLAQKLNLPILTSGDLVREVATYDKGMIGETCRKSLEAGKYVPDSEMYVLWKKKLKEDGKKKGWIMDGFPRNLSQAKFLVRKVDKYGYKIDKVFYLVISEDESYKRLIKRGRRLHPGNSELHDSPQRIKERLAIYKKGEKSLIGYFKDLGILEEIDGERPVEEIHQDIVSCLNGKEIFSNCH